MEATAPAAGFGRDGVTKRQTSGHKSHKAAVGRHQSHKARSTNQQINKQINKSTNQQTNQQINKQEVGWSALATVGRTNVYYPVYGQGLIASSCGVCTFDVLLGV